MPFIVCKFGGSSLAAGDRFLRVRDIIRSDPSRRAIVVSAPGRRNGTDEKITDQLIRYFETGDEALWRAIEARFLEIGETLGLDAAPLLRETRAAIQRKCNAAFAAGRGEYLSARLLAQLLGFRFVDAADCVRFTEGGALDRAATRREMLHCLCGEPFVLPGFYGADAAGYLRISDEEIRRKMQVYEPEILVIMDDSLVGLPATYAGLKEGGLVVLLANNSYWR